MSGQTEFTFDRSCFEKLFLEDEDVTEIGGDVGSWGTEEGQDGSLQVYDGYMQSVYNKCEPVMFIINQDPKLYEALAEKGNDYVNVAGCFFDTIPRGAKADGDISGDDTEGMANDASDGKAFITFVFGHCNPPPEEGGDGHMFLFCYPCLQGDGELRRTKERPGRLMHLLPQEGQPGKYQGAWAIGEDDWHNAEEIMKSFKEETKTLGDLKLKGDLLDDIKVSGSILITSAGFPAGPKQTAEDAFKQLLYTCKMNAMVNLQNIKAARQAADELVNGQRQMEEIFTACTTKLETFMLRHPNDFQGMSSPLEEIIGNGMGYTGLMYSNRFAIIISICKEMEAALNEAKKLLNCRLEDIQDDLTYEVLPWNSKSQSSIYTKITDYAAKKVEPQILSSCGLTGIKDYVRTRIVVPNGQDAKEAVENFLKKFSEECDDALFQDVVHKDKSFRFKPDGQAIYTTGYLMLPMAAVFMAVTEEAGRSWNFYTCRQRDPSVSVQEGGDWAMPFEIQVVNQAALDFINAAHHSYEIVRVSQRISSVCPCTKDKDGNLLPQRQCLHCMYRRSLGLGYCAFCHICFNSSKQKMDCPLPCCAGEKGIKNFEDELAGMDESALKDRLRAMEARVQNLDTEVQAWKQSFGHLAGTPRAAAKALKK